MVSVPASGDPRRVQFERVPVHSSEDVFKLKSQRPNKHSLKRFQEEYSALKSISMCGVNGHRCHGALCALCSPKRARRHRRDLMVSLSDSPTSYALLWTATIRCTPDRALRELWNDLDRLLSAVSYGQWLSRRVAGYARSVEVEHTPAGWHPHAHVLLVFKKKLTRPEAVKVALAIRNRYLRAADLRGIPASAKGQHVRVVPLTQISVAVDYITKSHMQTRDSRTPGTDTPAMLLRAAYQGDADALDLLSELERASYRRRTWQTGGVL